MIGARRAAAVPVAMRVSPHNITSPPLARINNTTPKQPASEHRDRRPVLARPRDAWLSSSRPTSARIRSSTGSQRRRRWLLIVMSYDDVARESAPTSSW